MKILQLRGYVLFLSMGLVIFFLGALAVILVRTKSSSAVVMPQLVGKNYVNVHNELVRLRLKITIENSRIPEKNDGEILSQSIPPGKSIESGSHVYLTVNHGFDRVEIPNFKGQTLQQAKEVMDKVLSGEVYISLPLGGVTYVPAEEGETRNVIIDQIPAPGTITHSGEKVYLLVTEQKNPRKSKNTSFLNQPFPFVAKALNRKKLPWKITEWTETKYRQDSGLVSAETEDKEIYEFKVSKPPKGNRLESGFEFWDWKAPEKGVYQVQMVNGELGEVETFFLPQSLEKGEPISLAYYREGRLQANIMTIDDKLIESKTWERSE